jgi:hypothetical protein
MADVLDLCYSFSIAGHEVGPINNALASENICLTVY